MANHPYYIIEPHKGLRKRIVETQGELYRTQHKLLYQNHPQKISYVQIFKHKEDVEYFFEKVLRPMEFFTDVENMKKKEAYYNLHKLRHTFKSHIKFFLYSLGFYFFIKPQPEWWSKYKLIYTPYVPFKEIPKRLGIALLSYTASKYAYIGVPWLICLYYPSILADLQIGEEFELGYWTNKFVKELLE